MRLRLLLAGAPAALCMLACSTPPEALDQANNGVHLTQSLQMELQRYQRNAKLAAARRLKSIERTETGAAQIVRAQSYETYLWTQSGDNDRRAASDRIREASDTYSKLAADQDAAAQELATRMAGIVTDLPSPADKLAAVQKAMAALGTELSMSERVAIVTKFLGDAKVIVDKNIQQADAAASAPAAVASSASAAG